MGIIGSCVSADNIKVGTSTFKSNAYINSSNSNATKYTDFVLNGVNTTDSRLDYVKGIDKIPLTTMIVTFIFYNLYRVTWNLITNEFVDFTNYSQTKNKTGTTISISTFNGAGEAIKFLMEKINGYYRFTIEYSINNTSDIKFSYSGSYNDSNYMHIIYT